MLNHRNQQKQTQPNNMSNPESRIFREMEENTRRENEQKAQLFERAAAHNTPTFEDFRADENSRQINADERYVERTKERFNNEENSYHAKAFEHIFQLNVAQGRWLNNPEDDSYRAEAIPVTEYDDFRNRIDIASTVHIPGEHSDSGEDEEYTFGIDLTTSADEATIRKKILYASNDPDFDGPVGFSQLRYYRNHAGQIGKKPLIPRYCIGVNRDSVDDVLTNTNIQNGHIRSRKPDYLQQFKVLHEMAVQNELFEGPLYTKEDDGTISEEEEQALRGIEQLDRVYLDERERIAKLLPKWTTEGAIDKNGNFNLDRIAQNIITNDEDRTFATILSVTERLSLDAFADPDQLKIEARRYGRRQSGETDRNLGHSAIRNIHVEGVN